MERMMMRGYGVDEQGWRKGPWAPEEDKLLTEYVNLHGEGRWSSVSKCTGLKRSGKSSRLRWVNYPRPGLKRGQLTPQEEGIVIELHAIWGNKWSTIASYLPGRTDNEIKNYWRTQIKKRSSSSLPHNPKRQRKSSSSAVINDQQMISDSHANQSSGHDSSTIHDEKMQLDTLLLTDDNCQKQQQSCSVHNMMNEFEKNQWADDHLVPAAASGSGKIIEDWLWSGLWNF